MCSPWRGGWEVRGAPLTSLVPHHPERHIKPQCKHKGISQNEFISKPHLVVTMVPKHSVPEGLVQPMEELFVTEGEVAGSRSGVCNGAPRSLCAHAHRGCPCLAVVTWCAVTTLEPVLKFKHNVNPSVIS